MKDQEFEFLVVDEHDNEHTESWTGRTMEEAAKRLLDCKYPKGRVIAWRYPRVAVTTTPLRNV